MQHISHCNGEHFFNDSIFDTHQSNFINLISIMNHNQVKIK